MTEANSTPSSPLGGEEMEEDMFFDPSGGAKSGSIPKRTRESVSSDEGSPITSPKKIKGSGLNNSNPPPKMNLTTKSGSGAAGSVTSSHSAGSAPVDKPNDDIDSDSDDETASPKKPKKTTGFAKSKQRGIDPPERRRCEFPVIVTDNGDEKAPCSLSGMGIKLRTKTFESQFGALHTITQTKHNTFIIGCYNQNQQQKVANSKTIAGIPVTSRIPTPWTEGVVYGIAPSEKVCPDDIEVVINNTPVKGLVRFSSNIITRNQKETNVLKVRFNLEKLPTEVIIHKTICKVHVFVGHVPRCTTCNRLGHTKMKCRNKVKVCSSCGSKDHGSDDCTNTKSCINCGGDHSASYQKCPSLLLLKNANRIRSENYMSKAEAVRKAKAAGDDGVSLANTHNKQFDSSVDMPPLPTSDFLKSSITSYAAVTAPKTRSGSDLSTNKPKESANNLPVIHSKKLVSTAPNNGKQSVNTNQNDDMRSIKDSINELANMQKTLLDRLDQDRLERSHLSDKIAHACIRSIDAEDSSLKPRKQIFIEDILKAVHKNKNATEGSALVKDLCNIFDCIDVDDQPCHFSNELITLSTICTNPCLPNETLKIMTREVTNNGC